MVDTQPITYRHLHWLGVETRHAVPARFILCHKASLFYDQGNSVLPLTVRCTHLDMVCRFRALCTQNCRQPEIETASPYLGLISAVYQLLSSFGIEATPQPTTVEPVVRRMGLALQWQHQCVAMATLCTVRLQPLLPAAMQTYCGSEYAGFQVAAPNPLLTMFVTISTDHAFHFGLSGHKWTHSTPWSSPNPLQFPSSHQTHAE